MANLEAVQAVVTQTAIWAAMVVVMVIREADVGPMPGAKTASLGKHRDKDMVDQL